MISVTVQASSSIGNPGETLDSGTDAQIAQVIKTREKTWAPVITGFDLTRPRKGTFHK